MLIFLKHGIVWKQKVKKYQSTVKERATMAEMFRMIPVGERPYEWAKAELETYLRM